MWVWGVYVLAVARLTGIITTDEITAKPRQAILRRLDEDSPLGTLLTCQWCMSMWVAAVVITVAWKWGTLPVFLLPALILAASQITGMLSDAGRG